MTGYEEALALTLDAVAPLGPETLPLALLAGRVAAAAVASLVDSPSTDVSLRDGFALRPEDVAAASADSPVALAIVGSAVAGAARGGAVGPGEAVRVTTGAAVPPGAGAVVGEEEVVERGGMIRVGGALPPGRNILARGSDLRAGEPVVGAGTPLRPATVGLLAAAGIERIDVVRRPTVGILATGDEVVIPGTGLADGEIYASNLATMTAWCAHYGMPTLTGLAGDDGSVIGREVGRLLEDADAVVTIGGAWRSHRDLVAGELARLGWRPLYHHVRIGPGKAVGFGLIGGKPVFCLPGGPPSSQMAFLQLALPCFLKLAGHRGAGLPRVVARLADNISGEVTWTQFIEGRLEETGNGGLRFRPRRLGSRLRSMAEADGYVRLPEGTAVIRRGSLVPVQIVPGTLPPPTAGAMLPPVLSFVAKSGSGKTTFLERLLPELGGRGLRVGVLKHHGHPTPFDVPGKDTYRMAQAGAEVVVGACSVQIAVFHREDGSADLDAVIARHFGGMDLVLTEGYKRGPYPKIEVHRAAWRRELLCRPEELLALVTDETFDNGVPQFGLDDAAGVADFLCGWLAGQDDAAPARP